MRQKKILLAVVMLCAWWPSLAQFTDSFQDGDFLSSPTWYGDDSRFVISGERLRLQAPPQAGVSSLATASVAAQEASWSFAVQLDFTPSSTNYAKVYLVSDQKSLAGALNGYFVKIGNTTREVSLYRQTGTTELEVIDGLDDRVNQAIVNLVVRVTRSAGGKWELFIDPNRLGIYHKEGETTDVVHSVSSWFGVQCVYTSTRSDKFWFDDFSVTGTRVPDTTPPEIVSIETPDASQVRVRFSEPINPSGIADALHIEGIGKPERVQWSIDSLVVDVEFSNSLVNGKEYVLTISGVADRSGNRLFATRHVLYFKPGKPSSKSVVITEIFSDPSPQVGLPAAEYVELYNRADEPFDLCHWVLTDGSSAGVLACAILRPREYIVLTSSGATPMFAPAPVVSVTNFPSLNNSGDRLQLLDDSGAVIDSVAYSLSWFRDEDKEEGGWSLELIDPANPCGEEGNWAASEDPSGGTPGRVNSVMANKPDLTPPTIVSVWPHDPFRLVVSFNELIQPPTEQTRISLYPQIPVAGASLYGETRREIEIRMSEVLQLRTAYTIHLSGIRDCIGNRMDDSELTFGVPEPADSGDVLISEILFNPRPGGADFVELYNASEKFLQLEGWQLGNGSSVFSLPRFLLHPGQWVALSEDPYGLTLQYPLANAPQIVHADLPSLPDDEGEVELLNSAARSFDRVNYHADWHTVFLKEDDGVSLERIDYTQGAQSPGNWISASSQAGYATPGRANSQQGSSPGEEDGVQVVPALFTHGDFAQIHYRLDHRGAMANIKVFNHGGSEVKTIAENEWLGTEGFFRWDGDKNDGERVTPGYYFIWFEWFDSMGRVETYRKRVIVTSR